MFESYQRHRHRGFSLIEMVLVVAIIMIVSSVLIPNLIDAIHKAKQKRTMAELNMIGTAWLSWLTDQVGVASAGQSKLYDTDGFESVSYDELFHYLHPSSTFFYMDRVPRTDGWGSSLLYFRNPDLRSDRQLMMCALARDNVADSCDISGPIPVAPFLATNYDLDIIWADGYLVRWPELPPNN